jgi:hypothetical protein
MEKCMFPRQTRAFCLARAAEAGLVNMGWFHRQLGGLHH